MATTTQPRSWWVSAGPFARNSGHRWQRGQDDRRRDKARDPEPAEAILLGLRIAQHGLGRRKAGTGPFPEWRMTAGSESTA
jgi:hypothetical protein